MNRCVRREYDRLRDKGWTAADALRAARIHDRWTDLENAGLVKLDMDPEIDCYDDSYIDTWGLSPGRAAREKREIHERINREGHWIVVVYARATDEDEWSPVDSCGGFIGTDHEDSGYDVDLMRAAIDAHDAMVADEASDLATRPSYAGVAS